MNDRPRREIRPADGRRDLSTIRAAAPNDPAPSYEVEVEPQPSLSDWVTERPALKLALAAVLVVAMLISEFVLRPTYERPEAWEGIVQVLDAKKANVLALTSASIALSAGISAIPDDTGTPIAEQLAQLANNLGIVLAVLYLEKYLLTILSTLAFGALIPLALGLFCAALLMHNNLSTSRVMRVAGTRVLVVAAVLLFLVPTSVWVTERVDSMHQSSIEQAETDAAANQDPGARGREEREQRLPGFPDRHGDRCGRGSGQRGPIHHRQRRCAGQQPHRGRGGDDRHLVRDPASGAGRLPVAGARAAGDRRLCAGGRA